MIKQPLLGVLGIAMLVGCSSGHSILGDWQITGVRSSVSGNISFKPGHAASGVIFYEPDHKMSARYAGRYDLVDNQLTITWQDLTMEGVPEAGQQAARRSLKQPQSGLLTWEGNDSVTWKFADGSLVFKR